MKPLQTEELHDICKVIGKIKSQLVEELPHHANEALLFHNDEITTGLLNNKTEIKIHLLTSQLLYSHNEENHFIDLKHDSVFSRLKEILSKYDIKMPEIKIRTVDKDQLLKFHQYAIIAKRILELSRMNLNGKFTMVHLWPHHLDFSVEWFTGKKDEQIGIGISPGDEQHVIPYFYMIPSPFDEKILNQKLPIGIWHTTVWKGMMVELKDLLAYSDHGIEEIKELFLIAKRNFELK